MSDELPKTNPPVIGEAATGPIAYVDGVGYANVISGTFVLTLCAAHWSPIADGSSIVSPDVRVVSRLRFNEEFARELHTVLTKMLAANAKPEGQIN